MYVYRNSLPGHILRNVLSLLDSPHTPRGTVYFVGLSWALMPRRDRGRPVWLNGSRLVEILLLGWSTSRQLQEAESRRIGCEMARGKQCPPGCGLHTRDGFSKSVPRLFNFCTYGKLSDRPYNTYQLMVSHIWVGYPSVKIPSTQTSTSSLADHAGCSDPP